MKDKAIIKKILRRHGKNKINLASEQAREILATEILERIEDTT